MTALVQFLKLTRLFCTLTASADNCLKKKQKKKPKLKCPEILKDDIASGLSTVIRTLHCSLLCRRKPLDHLGRIYHFLTTYFSISDNSEKSISFGQKQLNYWEALFSSRPTLWFRQVTLTSMFCLLQLYVVRLPNAPALLERNPISSSVCFRHIKVCQQSHMIKKGPLTDDLSTIWSKHTEVQRRDS